MPGASPCVYMTCAQTTHICTAGGQARWQGRDSFCAKDRTAVKTFRVSLQTVLRKVQRELGLWHNSDHSLSGSETQTRSSEHTGV